MRESGPKWPRKRVDDARSGAYRSPSCLSRNHLERPHISHMSTPDPTQEPSPHHADMASDTPPQSSPPGDGGGPEAALAQLQAQLAEAQDSFLRAKAEGENIRRRSEEEVSKARKYAIESFADSMLPVKDSLEAAIGMPDAPLEKVLEGVHATLRQLAQALERNKVIEINPPAATKFDPHQHQAISMVPAEQEANTVVAVLQKGYRIADRVLRPALVTVAAPK
jgi:molecular chaperone GrpE